jgi:hypothetical protein
MVLALGLGVLPPYRREIVGDIVYGPHKAPATPIPELVKLKTGVNRGSKYSFASSIVRLNSRINSRVIARMSSLVASRALSTGVRPKGFAAEN